MDWLLKYKKHQWLDSDEDLIRLSNPKHGNYYSAFLSVNGCLKIINPKDIMKTEYIIASIQITF
ncbi:hypothetical protein V8G69_15995 [Gaetbulibacter sp. M235]|uniref:hypothetical protein n=1 Tax=Gaetbulibacter sp. M235 TaxID=3126510 RepID=UPI00374ED500